MPITPFLKGGEGKLFIFMVRRWCTCHEAILRNLVVHGFVQYIYGAKL